jgi:hypothetical protein
MITVVIPLYNKERQIAHTLQTVLAQTYQDFEVVIVDDGSNDHSADIVLSFCDPRIRLIRQINAGVSAARNRGIAEARGEFVALLDADDEWMPDYLSTQMNLVETYSECDVFVTNYEFRNDLGKVTPTILRKLPFTGTTGVLSNYFEVASNSNPPICSITIMARKFAFDSVGGFPVGVKSGEDLLTWAKLACRYKIAFDTSVHAVFVQTSIAEAKPQIRLGQEDYIANELIKLYALMEEGEVRDQLKAYIARWYKVWSVLLIEANQNHKSFNTAMDGLKWGGSMKQFLPIIVLSMMPSILAKNLFYKLRR